MPTAEYPRGWGRCECLIRAIEQERFERLVRRAKMGEMKHMTLESYTPKTERQSVALRTIQEGHGSFYLFGGWGVGKTHLMAGTMLRAISMGIHSAILSVPKLLQEIRKSDRDGRADIERMAQSIPYLVLDDIGKEKVSDWTEERIFELIDDRIKLWQGGKAHTSFTSNQPLAVLAQRLDGAIIDRIEGMCQVLRLDGDSMRGRKRA